MKPTSFFYHYNKPASLSQKRNVLSIHFRGVCHLVQKVKTIGVDVESKNRKRQPRCVMSGKATTLFFNTENDGTVTGILA